MMWYVVYEIATGKLVSVGSSVGSDLASKGLTSKEYPFRPDQIGIWNEATLDFDPRPVSFGKISTTDFMLRFTEAERKAVRESPNDKAVDFREMLRLSATVNLDSAYIQASLDAMEQGGMLAAGRATEILEG